MTNQTAQTMPELPDGAKTPYKPPYASVLGTRCAELARAISYHDPEPIGAIKHTLREAAYFIDSQCVTVTKTRDGLRMRTARGQERYMNWRELLAYFLLRNKTEIRP